MRSPAQIQKMLTNLFEEGQRVRAVHLYMLIFDSTISEAHHTLSKNNEQTANSLGDLLADLLSKSRK